jgi:hypothetical protein
MHSTLIVTTIAALAIDLNIGGISQGERRRR